MHNHLRPPPTIDPPSTPSPTGEAGGGELGITGPRLLQRNIQSRDNLGATSAIGNSPSRHCTTRTPPPFNLSPPKNPIPSVQVDTKRELENENFGTNFLGNRHPNAGQSFREGDAAHRKQKCNNQRRQRGADRGRPKTTSNCAKGETFIYHPQRFREWHGSTRASEAATGEVATWRRWKRGSNRRRAKESEPRRRREKDIRESRE